MLYLTKRADLVRFFTLRTSSASEAEDIVQELSLKLLGIDDANIQSPAAYLYMLGSNVMLDRIRARRRALADRPSLEAMAHARQRLQRLIRRVEALPPQCQQVFVMHKFDDRSYAQIAEALGISRSAVEKHMIAAFKGLSEGPSSPKS